MKTQLLLLLSLVFIAFSTTSCEYDLTLDYGIGLGGIVVTTTYSANTQVSVSAPDDFGTGYHFIGWAKKENGEPFARNFIVTMDDDYTYYGIWNKMYTITLAYNFFQNGQWFWRTSSSTWEEGKSSSIVHSIDFFIDDAEVAKQYNFLGWYTSPDGSGGYVDTVFTVKSDMTLYAVYDKVECDVYFDLNGGVGTTPQKIQVKKGDYITLSSLPTTGFSNGLSSFEGWGLSKTGVPLSSDLKVMTDIKLYAVWSSGQVKDKTKD